MSYIFSYASTEHKALCTWNHCWESFRPEYKNTYVCGGGSWSEQRGEGNGAHSHSPYLICPRCELLCVADEAYLSMIKVVQSTMPQRHLFMNFPKFINCCIFLEQLCGKGTSYWKLGCFPCFAIGVSFDWTELSCCSDKYLYFRFIIWTFLTQSAVIFAFSVRMWIAITYCRLHCLSQSSPWF